VGFGDDSVDTHCVDDGGGGDGEAEGGGGDGEVEGGGGDGEVEGGGGDGEVWLQSSHPSELSPPFH